MIASLALVSREMDKQAGCYTCACYLLSFVSCVALIPGFALVVLEIKEALTPAPYRYIAGDTRIISPYVNLCGGLTLRITSSVALVDVTLYALSAHPKLVPENELVRHLSIRQKGDYDYFYLYPRSNVTISACTYTVPYYIYVIEGRQNFEAWKIASAKSGRLIDRAEAFLISAECDANNNNTFDTYATTVTTQDDWYFASGGRIGTATFALKRFQYEVDIDHVVASCTVNKSDRSKMCTLAKQDDSVYYMVLIGPGPGTSEVRLSVECEIGGGSFAAIILIPILGCCYCCGLFCNCIITCRIVCGLFESEESPQGTHNSSHDMNEQGSQEQTESNAERRETTDESEHSFREQEQTDADRVNASEEGDNDEGNETTVL